jgi:hypothetical protein
MALSAPAPSQRWCEILGQGPHIAPARYPGASRKTFGKVLFANPYEAYDRFTAIAAKPAITQWRSMLA